MRRTENCRIFANTDRGIILIAVLWIVLLLSVIALGFVRTTRTEVRIAANVVENARAKAMAEAGINAAIIHLLADSDEEPWIPDGRRYALPFGRDRVEISLYDETGKIDLNKGSPAHLAALFRVAGVADQESEELVSAILDWRDADSLRRIGGAEAADYRRAGLSYGPKNAEFDDVTELLQVLGMTPELFARVQPGLTVYSGRAVINWKEAPEIVLRAIYERSPDKVATILDERATRDPTEFRGTYPDIARIGRFVRRARRGTYTIRAYVETEKGSAFIRDAVVKLTGDADRPVIIQGWRQPRPSEPQPSDRE